MRPTHIFYYKNRKMSKKLLLFLSGRVYNNPRKNEKTNNNNDVNKFWSGTAMIKSPDTLKSERSRNL